MKEANALLAKKSELESLLKDSLKEFTDSINTSSIKIDTLSSIHPIKNIQEFSFSNDYMVLGLAATVILGILIYLFVLRRPKKSITQINIKKEDIFYWVQTELEKIEKEAREANFSYKIYFMKISDLIREFIFRLSSIDAPRKTSSAVLKEIQIEKVKKETLAQEENRKSLEYLLNIADKVKFSKQSPNIKLVEEYTKVVRDFVRRERWNK